MPDRHWIEELPQHAGQTVSVRGWVTTTRSSGKIAFVVVRDGTGLLQAVLSKKDLPADVWDAFGKLTQETSVEVTGVVRAFGWICSIAQTSLCEAWIRPLNR